MPLSCCFISQPSCGARRWTPALGVILAISIGFAVAGIILAHSMFGIHFSARALWFVALYIWCVLGMMFVASRGVHRGKLFLGLASQAGVLYTLFIFF